MAELERSPLSTPKRKRDDSASLLGVTQFSFEIPETSGTNDGGGSPRTKVAQKFRDLALNEESGGGVAVDAANSAWLDETMIFEASTDDLGMRKRVKLPDVATEATKDPGSALEPAIAETAGAGNALKRAYPSINRLSESRSRGKKRAISPPLTVDRSIGDDVRAEGDFFDALRASMTWHEDEITVYDPDDEDDDGTGINGIGFKPTPALAHARSVKRRAQLAEYKKREDSEARARRNQRRRGGPEPVISLESEVAVRRVHFMEVEPNRIATI